MGGDRGEGEEDAMGSHYYSVVKQIAFQSNARVQLLCLHIPVVMNKPDVPSMDGVGGGYCFTPIDRVSLERIPERQSWLTYSTRAVTWHIMGNNDKKMVELSRVGSSLYLERYLP